MRNYEEYFSAFILFNNNAIKLAGSATFHTSGAGTWDPLSPDMCPNHSQQPVFAGKTWDYL